MTVRDPKQILREELSKRMGANPQYSLRAFARDLKLSPQQLSNVLNGRKGLSVRAAATVAERLGFSADERDYFCHLVQSRFARGRVAKDLAQSRLKELREAHNEASASLSLDSFRIISDWYHFALLELIKIEGGSFKKLPAFARRLGIPRIEVEMALGRLERLELVSRGDAGFAINQETVMTPTGVPSEALRNFHRQVIEKALASVTTQSVNERVLNTTMLPVARSQVPQAQKMIDEFWRSFVAKISAREGERDVYALAIQFFNLTPNQTENKEPRT